MISREKFSSATGLRPMSAFVVIATVVIFVAGWVTVLSARRPAAQPDRTQCEEGKPSPFAIIDAGGRTLARCVPRFDLVMSPRSMWQAHTPLHMADRLSALLDDGRGAGELLAAMLPDATDGRIEVDRWQLSARQAFLLDEWIADGAGCGGDRLAGIWVERGPRESGSTRHFRLHWKPAVLLSRAERERHGYASAWSWARRLAVGLASIVRPDARAEDGASDAGPVEDRVAERCEEVWKALLPSGFCRPVRGIHSDRVLALRRLLREEGVSPWQMRIAYEADRAYPSGRHELFGSWGFTRPEQTEAAAREGLELMSSRLLASEDFAFLRSNPPIYTWLQDRTVRGERANGFLSFDPCSEAPRVQSTIEVGLLQQMRRVLERVMDEHQPALAMGIVLDLATGDVMALDSVEEYEYQPLAPIYHVFTPGSTAKINTMAVALEEGAVTPETSFEVGDGQYRLVDPETGRTRTIHEAEGSKTGVITASEALAYSVNAGLAQIGLRVPAPVFRAYLEALGYGRTAGSGLGIEKAGHLRALPWKYRFTHASVGFGHEISTTLWQHAAALATVIRGGERVELRLLENVQQDGRVHPIPRAPERRVFSARTSRTVREMMAMGANEGTGVEAAELLLEAAAAAGRGDLDRESLQLGTKTGTAQKVSSEICLHVELAERDRCSERGLAWTRERYAGLRQIARPHRGCYTSSMCAVARRPDDGREIMVLVVVDEPRGQEKFGSRVAGPAAMDILAEALGFTRAGRAPSIELVGGFGISTSERRNLLEEPWRGEAR